MVRIEKRKDNREEFLLPPEGARDLTLGKIRSMIPKHCFDRSYSKSLQYLFQDLAMVALLMFGASCIQYIPLVTIRALAWVAYWWIQGNVMTGLWVIAHECGHESFSPSVYLNDAVGCVLHTMLFVPYFSWKHSHALHHSNTGSWERDTVHRPHRKCRKDASVFARIRGLLALCLLGWPFYLFIDAAGPAHHRKSFWPSHFNPFCPLFRTTGQKIGCIVSDICLLAWIYTLYQLCQTTSAVQVFFYYGPCCVVVNFWLVSITYLQHTDYAVPRMYDSSWDWLRGALGTVDRDYGIYNYFHHHIADTHVVHHLFSKIPHYHAQEATKAIVESGLIEKFHLIDNTPWYKALWNEFSECWYLEGEDVAWFQNYPADKKKA